MNAWISHVKSYQAQHGCSYKDALRGASATYRKGSGLRNQSYDPSNPQYHTVGGNLKKTSKAQLKRLIEALGDKAIGKLSGMGAVGDMLKQQAADTTAQLISSGGNRASSEMTNRGRGMRGRGAVGDMLKQQAADTTAQLIRSGGNRASSEMTTRGTGINDIRQPFSGATNTVLHAVTGSGVSRIKKAGKWEQFANATVRDAIDTAGKAGRVYYDTTSPLAQLGFGLKKHRKLKGKALMAAGYS
jgi:hypothetical protein